ncbi:MAG: hypothetical protein K8S87_08765 [Planctomycetes bacterium]|nr:hypothetical protein [Planctomycetota bacterium]
MFSEIFCTITIWKFLQIAFFLLMMLLFVWIYIKFRRSQPAIYIRNLPSPVPPRDYSSLPVENQEEARFFWEFLDKFKEDFEKTGHPLQYRQLIDLLQYGPIMDLKIFSAETLLVSKHIKKYAADSVLRKEIYENIIENLQSNEKTEQSASAFTSLLLVLPLTQKEMLEIISIFEQESKISYIIEDVIVKLKSKLNRIDT